MTTVEPKDGHTRHYSRLMNLQSMTFSSASSASTDPEQLCRNASVVGARQQFTGPFGERVITYCDWTASGRPVKAIEDFMQSVVLPLYANTHTTTSITGHQMTLFRHEARLLVKQNVKANFSHGNEKDVCLFVGNGSTGAINTVISLMGLRTRPAGSVTVFIGPYEHHSNMLPWRECHACSVRSIRATASGDIDFEI